MMVVPVPERGSGGMARQLPSEWPRSGLRKRATAAGGIEPAMAAVRLFSAGARGAPLHREAK